MITEKPHLYWYNTRSHIENGVIYEIDHKERTAYSVLGKTELLKDFISIDENNLNCIETFISKYGFLQPEYKKDVGTALRASNEWIPYNESLSNFQKEVSTLKALQVLHNVSNSDDPKVVLDKNSDGSLEYKLVLARLARKKPGNDIENKVFAADVLVELINEKIKKVCPALYLDLDFKVNSSWRVNSLIETIYIKFYETIMGGKELRKCANTRCPKGIYFEAPIRHKKNYCSLKCAVQGMQNDNSQALKDPNSPKYFPAKIAFLKRYNRLRYLESNKKIDMSSFEGWNKQARKLLKNINGNSEKEIEFYNWLQETGNEENFLLKKERE